jgi:hypothetical protein
VLFVEEHLDVVVAHAIRHPANLLVNDGVADVA